MTIGENFGCQHNFTPYDCADNFSVEHAIGAVCIAGDGGIPPEQILMCGDNGLLRESINQEWILVEIVSKVVEMGK